MFMRIAIAAGLTSAVLAAAVASVPASAGPLYDAFCKGPTPTPQHVCDTIKAAEKNKPAAASAQLQANGDAASQLQASQPQASQSAQAKVKRR